MNPVRPRWLLALLPWCAGLALAQQPAPAPSADAMERARRDAANPMRVILEARRLPPRRRAEGASPPPGVSAQPAAPAPAPAPSRRDNAVAAPPAPPAAPALAVDAAPPARVPEPAVVPAVPEAAPASEAVPPVPEPAPAVRPAPDPVVAPPTVPEPAPAPMPPPSAPVEPTLLSLVEPAIPPGVLGRAGALREVTADLSLRADGTVAAVALASGTPRAAARYLEQAFVQWRFAPLPEARVHRVQLVFNP